MQARTDFVVFSLLRRSRTAACHALHYLQMATELLGKAHAWKHGPCVQRLPRAFVGFLRSLSTNRKAQKQLGYEGQNESWRHLIRKSLPLAERTEDFALSASRSTTDPIRQSIRGRNAPKVAPAEHVFEIWHELRKTAAGRQSLIWPAASSQQPTLSCEQQRTIVERRAKSGLRHPQLALSCAALGSGRD